MKFEHIEDGGIWVTQGKTKVQLWLPFTKRLTGVLDGVVASEACLILTGESGHQLNYDQLQKQVIRVRKAAGLIDYSLHGLSYSTAGELAEAGCTDYQLAAAPRHKSLSMVQKYSKGANQKRLAKEAQNLREQKWGKT
ncbi:tyrosine-type recombinase/integrase [Tritonibacter mobilis]|uniref:tyrosine-type recombinase/integrase n=1 Tax=Tritonibacter mobilis TaxID=379347 RepID=UPI001C093A7E|nr:tyrosine-type recombinase/integrase [Tritonibacter mobilis]MBU3033759.1 tyrosine-type recombinase/integrase [Tritonibacter mobilis]WHQ84812.1 tyrosine-type recombinase/integrase [Tritonibacter mobilis]